MPSKQTFAKTLASKVGTSFYYFMKIFKFIDELYCYTMTDIE